MPRKIKHVSKPATADAKRHAKPETTTAAKPAKRAAKPVSGKPAAPSTATAIPAGAIRDANNAAKLRTHYGAETPRDVAYLREYAERYGDKPFTTAELHGQRAAHYDGSNKLSDVGVIVRLTKAGSLRQHGDGKLSLTAAGLAIGRNAAKRKLTASAS